MKISVDKVVKFRCNIVQQQSNGFRWTEHVHRQTLWTHDILFVKKMCDFFGHVVQARCQPLSLMGWKWVLLDGSIQFAWCWIRWMNKFATDIDKCMHRFMMRIFKSQSCKTGLSTWLEAAELLHFAELNLAHSFHWAIPQIANEFLFFPGSSFECVFAFTSQQMKSLLTTNKHAWNLFCCLLFYCGMRNNLPPQLKQNDALRLIMLLQLKHFVCLVAEWLLSWFCCFVQPSSCSKKEKCFRILLMAHNWQVG